MKQTILILLILTQFAASAQRTGKDYAVFFYVTDFKPGWATLPETAKEAADLKTELETNFGFTCEAVANPSKAQILAKIKNYNDRLSENDQVLFFFSMHGHYEESAERGFLIAADGVLQDEYGDTWLSYDDLSGYLARCKAKHVLLALDACHSGAFGIRNKARPDVPSYSQAEDCTQRVAKTFQFAGRQFCTSGNKSSKTPAKSLFAMRFLETLRKGGQDGIIRFDDLEYFLGKMENLHSESGMFLGHEAGGDFVFVQKNLCVAQPASSPSDAADLPTSGLEAGTLMPDGMVFIKGGKFQMGSPITEIDRGSGEQQHEVELSDFYMGKYEVTQKQWSEVMGKNPSYFKNCDDCPVEQVSWEDIQRFIQKLNQQSGKTYRLPTEAEWEYAARGGGKATLFGNGKNIADPKEINFNGSAAFKKSYSVAGEYRQKTVPAGSLNSPNILGMHDMSGNVREWCGDWYGTDYYKSSPAKNPTGPSTGYSRVVRGGSWVNSPQNCRAANRDYDAPGVPNFRIGFRLARSK